MAVKDLRQFLHVLQDRGELLSIEEEVDLRFELSEYLKQFDAMHGPALLFKSVKGHGGQIAGNLIGTKKRLALAFGVKDEEKLLETFLKRRARKIEPRKVRSGPVKQVIVREQKEVDLTALPIPTYHEGDGGPYISCGILVSKSPSSGLRSMGLHRLQIKGKRRMGVHLSNPPISAFAAEAERDGKPLDVAVALGVHPVLLLASVVTSPNEDKLAIASSLLGSAVEMVRCATVDCEVPAHAELVIEGRVLPNVREKEGPFGETSGYYFSDDSCVIEATGVSHRKEPILQALHPTVQEVALLGGPAGEAEMLRMLRQRGFAVQDLVVNQSSNRTHVALSLRKKHDGEARQLLYFLLSGVPYIKHAVVVDDDVNVHDAQEIEWAISTRFQADNDLVIVPNLPARSIDPSKKAGEFTTKAGLDATVPMAQRERFKRITVPATVREKVAKAIGSMMRERRGESDAGKR
ncbi:MAG: UbiD family decarboxylase [Deltaproteobacteria bacterium]|nr:UbiD family decarboxylase [Deltaproteobacteria bacterium]